MITFPDYDFGWDGGTEAAIAESEASKINQTAGTDKPAPDFTLGVVFDDLGTGITEAVKDVASVPGKVFEGVTSTVRNTWLYLIGGLAIVAILAIVLLGAGTRFAGSIQGLK